MATKKVKKEKAVVASEPVIVPKVKQNKGNISCADIVKAKREIVEAKNLKVSK